MVVRILQVVAGVVGVAAVLGAVFVVSFRLRFRPVLTAVRRMNRRFMNPRQLRSAGQPGAYAAVVRHVGRSSGRRYRTPVVAVPADDAFLVVLPYGPGADWVRNVLAAGGAEVEHEGEVLAVDRPTLVPIAEADPYVSAGDRRMNRSFGIDQALRLHRTSA